MTLSFDRNPLSAPFLRQAEVRRLAIQLSESIGQTGAELKMQEEM